MKRQERIILVIFISAFIFCFVLGNLCLAQENWPVYTNNVLYDSLIDYIQSATIPGSIIVSGCWGYPWFAVAGNYPLPSNSWSKKNYYMFYPPIGWFKDFIYPFWNIYNVANPYQDFPNFSVLMDNPGMWPALPFEMMLDCRDPICYYLGGGIHMFSGAASIPYLILMRNNPSIEPSLLTYISLMGLFDYEIPPRFAYLPAAP